MKKFKKLLATVLIGVMLLNAVGCGKTETEQTVSDKAEETTQAVSDKEAGIIEIPADSEKIKEIQNKGKLVLGTASGYPPFEFVSVENNGAVIGIDVAFAQAIADQLGVKLEVQDMAFSELVTSLSMGNCDIVIAGMPETPEKAEVVDFSNVYVNDEQTIIVRAEDADKYTSLADFEGKTVDVEMGSSSATVATDEMLGAKINTLSLIADCFLELEQGKCDAVVTGMVVGKQYVIANDKFAEIDSIIFENKDKPTQACIAKGDAAFLEFINAVIKENQDNGSFDKWIDEYSAQASKEAE